MDEMPVRCCLCHNEISWIRGSTCCYYCGAPYCEKCLFSDNKSGTPMRCLHCKGVMVEMCSRCGKLTDNICRHCGTAFCRECLSQQEAYLITEYDWCEHCLDEIPEKNRCAWYEDDRGYLIYEPNVGLVRPCRRPASDGDRFCPNHSNIECTGNCGRKATHASTCWSGRPDEPPELYSLCDECKEPECY